MIAIKAARRFREEGIQEGYEEEEWFEKLSANEMSLFQNLMALQIDEEAALQIAERLDSGGVIMEKELLLAQHQQVLPTLQVLIYDISVILRFWFSVRDIASAQALENCTQMEAAQKAGETKLSIRSGVSSKLLNTHLLVKELNDIKCCCVAVDIKSSSQVAAQHNTCGSAIDSHSREQ